MTTRPDLLTKVRIYHPEACALPRVTEWLRDEWARMDAGMRKGDIGVVIDLLDRLHNEERARWIVNGRPV